jgi:hypothetical protein
MSDWGERRTPTRGDIEDLEGRCELLEEILHIMVEHLLQCPSTDEELRGRLLAVAIDKRNWRVFK